MNKKSIEDKIGEKFVIKDRVFEIIKEINIKSSNYINGLDDTNKVGDAVFDKIWHENFEEIEDMVGQRPFEIKKLRRIITNLSKKHLEEYLDSKEIKEKLPL